VPSYCARSLLPAGDGGDQEQPHFSWVAAQGIAMDLAWQRLHLVSRCCLLLLLLPTMATTTFPSAAQVHAAVQPMPYEMRPTATACACLTVNPATQINITHTFI
jgi:hypothetical protein